MMKQRDATIGTGVVGEDTREEAWMTEAWRVATENGLSKFTRSDDGAPGRPERRGPNRPQGDSQLPAHIMAAIREIIRAAAATCVDPARLESSGPYEWLAIVESCDAELSRHLRGYIASCRYLDELQQQHVDFGRSRMADAMRDATFAKNSMRRSLEAEIGRRRRAD